MTTRITNTETALTFLAEAGIKHPGKINGEFFAIKTYCVRCGGSGIYSHFHGDCWKCFGTGDRRTTQKKIVTYAREEKAKITARESKMRKARLEKVANWRGFLRQNPEMIEVFRTCDHRIVRDLAGKVHRFGELSDKQIALAKKLASEAANPAPTGIVPDGDRTEVTGTVISTREVVSNYGVDYKMLIEVATEAGPIRLYGSIPKAILLDTEKGVTVTLTATLKRSEKDEGFGFFSRPSKASVAA